MLHRLDVTLVPLAFHHTRAIPYTLILISITLYVFSYTCFLIRQRLYAYIIFKGYTRILIRDNYLHSQPNLRASGGVGGF